jgi:hypothetical protein
MVKDESIKPQKIGRNDPCRCGSGIKYKSCCMKKEGAGIKGTIKKFSKAFGQRLVIDNAKKIPIISSAIGAVEDINEEDEKKNLHSQLTQIKETTSTSLGYISNMDSLAPIFDPISSLKKIDGLASILQTTIENNQNYDIQLVSIEQNKRILRVTPKEKPIEFNVKFKIPNQKLEGLSSIEELIEDKIKEGDSAVFTEDEIESFTFLDTEIGQFWENQTFNKLEFKPQISDIPFQFSFIVKNTEIAYHNVKIGSIYKNENEATLVTTNLPFDLLIRMKIDPPSLILKFNIDLKDNFILDINKFFNFLSSLNEGNPLILKDSKRGNVFFETSKPSQIEIDEDTLNLVRSLAIIDTVYCTNFTYPEYVTNNDIQQINEIISIIENKCLTINSVTSTFTSDVLAGVLNRYKEKGYFENLSTNIPISYDLFGKKINIGEGKVIFEKGYIRESIPLLEKEVSRKENIEITFVPGDSTSKILFK